MDELGWSWPFWKFGMKGEDLFTTLHDQYNTIPSSIQDPEAFHHDVWEISKTASTSDEFHCLLAHRKEQRLRELNETLESASFEIIGNPKLIGSEQWQYAVQLFRTRSLDSLVRYFASYLPDDHPWHQVRDDDARTSSTVSSMSDSVTDSLRSDDSLATDMSKPFFDDAEHECLTHEPLTIHTSLPASHLPPSPRSMTMCSDSSAVSPIDTEHQHHEFGTLTPARTLSFSESGSDYMIHSATLSQCGEDDTSQADDDLYTPFSSISDIADEVHHGRSRIEAVTPAEREGSVGGTEEPDTPTPRNEVHSDAHCPQEEYVNSSSTHISTSRSSSSLYNQVLQEYTRSSRKGRRDDSPSRSIRRTSPEIGRIQKPLSDSARTRPHGRRRND
ncbi:hypothetical protein BKA67DRAFT_571031 [Truncatella angustata]|uniref:Uncharacterized protein n=1 Tax=Truncatella angustata TaxID=152316 RepID=A0A9P8UG10_9PEZI|nr:uncharacterized protein BKA67DRAFT_571031 [Truncatella angustata]KAH6651470.1 hypothetical protein BKA67DRAFT_571031 [Truncatella angustata]